MLKVATVFSGIGAPEHALKRLGIQYEIEFACDNGDVDIFSKKIDDAFSTIELEFANLSKMIENKDYEWLNNKYKSIDKRVAAIKPKLLLAENKIITAEMIFDKYANSKYINANQRKDYARIHKKIDDAVNKKDLAYEYMKFIVKLNSDLKRNANKQLDCLANGAITKEDVKQYKDVTRKIKSIKNDISMLYGNVKTEMARDEIFSMATLEEQKKFVDNLYKGQETRNKVMQSYLANYEIDKSQFHWNAALLDGRSFNGKVDVLVGGSPCQSFSLLGKQKGLNDTRGTLFYEYARLVKEIKPKVFIFENVKAVLSNDCGRTWQKMQEVFDSLGYNWKMEVLNAKDYGIPQNRNRIFVVGIRNDIDVPEYNFPKPIELKTTMQDYLIDNVSGKYYLNRKGVDFVISEKRLKKKYTQIDGDIQLCQKKNQQFNWCGDFVFVEENKNKEHLIEDLEKYFLSEKVKKCVMSPGTKGFYAKPEIDLEIARPLLATMHKMHRAGVDNYVTTEGRIRKLTPRECLRLMGFCDSFKIVVSDTAAYQQAGNSIVVNVLMHIIKSVIDVYPDLIE